MKKLLLLAAISFVFVTNSDAQTNNNENKSPKQGQWQKGNNQWQGRNGQSRMDQLNLTQEQKDQMKKLSQDMQSQRKAIMDDNALSQEQKRAKLTDLRKSRQDGMAKILTADQLKQLNTTTYRNNSGKKSMKPGNAKKMKRARTGKMQKAAQLNLTQDQKDKMASIRKDAATQRKVINDDQSLTKEQKSEKLKTLNSSMRTQMSDILTPEQKEQLKGSIDQQKINNKGKFGKVKKG